MIQREQDDGIRKGLGVLLQSGARKASLIDNVHLHRPTGFQDSRDRLWRHEWFTRFSIFRPSSIRRHSLASGWRTLA